MLPPLLRVCADDFGLHAGINEAVLQLAAEGIVDATGCMVGAPAWAAGAARLRRAAPSLQCGLHLDFTEHPLLRGQARGLRALILASHLRVLDRRAVQAEVRAQLDAFEQAMGRSPDFVDGHQHVHQLPVIREVLVEELMRRGARPWLRSTRRVPGLPQPAKAWFIETLGARALASLCDQAGLRRNARLLGVYDFRGGAPTYTLLLQLWLRHAGPGDLLMCHPSATVDRADPIGAARRVEFDILRSL